MSKLYYETFGSGPPLVLVHGLGGSGQWWLHNIEPLSWHFTLYVVDLPGFGRSAPTCSLVQLVSYLPAWLDEVGLERVQIVGHSMGGYLVQHLAATQPERVERLVLMGTLGVPLYAKTHDMVLRFLSELENIPLPFWPTMISDGLHAGIPALWRLTDEICKLDARPLMAQIQVPTLILWGEHDWLLPVEMGIKMAHLIPKASFYVIENAGHNVMIDQPEAVNQHLLDFLSKERRLKESAPQAGLFQKLRKAIRE
ncbi:MAG: alpha/beta fold hydrolase [Ardenticatenaceae bacterium]